MHTARMQYLLVLFLTPLLSLAAPESPASPNEISTAGTSSTRTHRTISYDSRLFDDRANAGWGQFGIELYQGIGFLFDLFPPIKARAFGREAFLLGFLLLEEAIQLNWNWTVTYHEFGHGTRFSAFGFPPFYTDLVANAPVFSNIWGYLFYNVTHGNQGGLTYTNSSYNLTGADDAVTYMGGMNNTTYFAELMDREIEQDRGHLAYLLPYFQNKLDPLRYTTITTTDGDPKGILDYYTSTGGGITGEHIKWGSAISLLTSASFYSLLYAQYRYLAEGMADVPQLRIGAFDLPNSSFYLTSKGLSFRVSSQYRSVGEWRFPFSLEVVYLGTTTIEPTVSAIRRLDNIDLSAYLYGSNGIGAGMSGTYYWGKVQFHAGTDLFNRNTLFGERNSVVMSGTGLNVSLWARAAWAY